MQTANALRVSGRRIELEKRRDTGLTAYANLSLPQPSALVETFTVQTGEIAEIACSRGREGLTGMK